MPDSLQWKGKKAEALFYAILFLGGVFLFLTVGAGEPVLFDDSRVYLRVERNEGVMPLYPLFVLLNQYFFQEAFYLRAVIIEQALLAAGSLTLFVGVLKKQFALKIWECCLIFCFLLYPYTIEMPEVMMTQAILSEGVAYSLFYLFVILLMKAVWNKNYGWLAGAAGMALVLSLNRSQLQILFGVCGIILGYLICMRGERGNGKKTAVRILAGLAGCLAVSLAGLMLVSRLNGVYLRMLEPETKLYNFAMMVQELEEEQENIRRQNESEEAIQQEIVQIAPESRRERLLSRDFAPSQYVSLIFSRGMYEADREDAALFEDAVIRGLFLELYKTADAQGQLHSHEEKGLWMWRDIVDGIGMIGKTCLGTPSEYYVDNYEEIILADNFSDIRNAHLQTIGMTLLKAHFGRFLYHTLILLPQAFISTVFFQLAPVYLLCHLVTLFLYLSALALMIWGYADPKADNRDAEFMAFVLGTNVVIVLIISLVFYGQQRYLVYNFGIFYTAYYLLLRQLWRCRIKEKVQSMRSGRKKDIV